MTIVSSFAFATVGLNSYMVQKIELRFVESRQVNLDFFILTFVNFALVMNSILSNSNQYSLLIR